MNVLLEHALTNAALAVPLAALAWFSRALRRPAWTHALWVLVLVRLVAPPLGCLPRAWFVPSPGAQADAPANAVETEGAAVPGDPVPDFEEPDGAALAPEDVVPIALAATLVDPIPPARTPAPAAPWPWQSIVISTWLAGAAGCFALTAVRVVRFQRLLSYARPAPAAWQRTAEGLARRLGLRQTPGVWLVPGAVPPLLWSLAGRPRLLLPDGLLHAIGPVPRAAVLAHELAHLRRRDTWVRWLELVATGLYWWHPLAWWAGRGLRDAEEECCDAWVVWALPGARRAYATTLVDALDYLSNARPALPPLASGFGRAGHLRRRLTMIMCGTGSRGLGWAGRAAVFGMGALLVALGPGRAQEPPKPPEPPSPGRPDGPAAEGRRARAEEEVRRAEREAVMARAMEELRRAEADAKRAQERVGELRERLERMERDMARGRRGPDGDERPSAPAAGRVRREGPGDGPGPDAPGRPRPGAPAGGGGRGGFGPGPGPGAPSGLPGGGFPGGGGFGSAGAFGGNPNQLFDMMAKGKNVINRDDLDDNMKRMFDGMAQRMGNTSGHITREQFVESMPKRGAERAAGAGFGGSGGFGGGGFASGSSATPFGGDRRIENLEKQLEALRGELRELRRELRRPPEPRPAPPGGGGDSKP